MRRQRTALAITFGFALAAMPIPQSVATWFGHQAIPLVKERSQMDAAFDFSMATTAGTPVEIHRWSAEFGREGPYDAVTLTSGDWVASIQSSSGSLGTVTAHEDSARSIVELVGFDDDAELGNKLDSTHPDAIVVFDGATNSWVVLENDTVTALNATFFASPLPLEEFRRLLIADRAGPSDTAFDWPTLLRDLLVLLAVVVLATVIIALALRRRKSTPRP
jgi:hypothetical protein